MNERIILFDGVCNLCNRSVKFIIQHDPSAIFKFASFQSGFGEAISNKYNLSHSNPQSLILIDNDQLFNKSTAALKIARQLNGLWPLFYIFIILPKPIRDFFYDLIARNRYKIFGKRDSCMIPEKQHIQRFIE